MAFADTLAALSPIAWYRMGEASGTTLVDSSGNGHDGTYAGGFTLGASGLVGDADTAVTLDGSTGTASVPHGAWMDTGDFSLFVVVNPASLDWLEVVGRDQVLDLELTDTGQVYCGIKTSYFDDLQGGSVTVGTKVAIGVSYDATAGVMSLNVDGVNVGTKALPGPLSTAANALYVGSYKGNAGTFQDGTFDELALFDTVLTDADFAALVDSMGGGSAPTPIGSDLSFGNYAITFSGETDLDWFPPAATPPAGAFPSATPMVRVYHDPGTPTLDEGRPVFAGFGTETITPWCDYLRVTVGGRDVTWFRGVQTVINGWQQLDPYGDGPASLTFPLISEFENPGVGDLAWLKPSVRVVINRVIDGEVVDAADPLWLGLVTRDTLESGPAHVDLEGAFMGREARKGNQPYILHNIEDTLYGHIDRMFRRVYRADFLLIGDVTGPPLRTRGDRSMTRLGIYDHWLGLSDQEDGTSYTLLPDRSVGRNVMRLQTRSMASVDCTVVAGAHGVKVNGLARDMQPNRIYGEGQSPDGSRWRNAVYPNAGYDDDVVDFPMAGSFGIGTTDADTINGDGITLLTRRLWSLGLLERDDAGTPDFDAEVEEAVNDFRRQLGLTRNGLVTTGLWDNLYNEGFNHQSLQGVHFEPIAAATETVQYLRGPGGREVGLNPDYDRTVMPFEEFVSYGENVTKREAKKNARGRINRAPTRAGTLVLTSDPAEMSRFEIRGGMTLLVKNLAGTGATGLKLYVSSAEVDWTSGSVTLAVATTALHFGELQTIRQRQMEARQNPSRRALRMFRKSGGVSDRVVGWEAEGPSGVIPRRHVTGGQWNMTQVIAAEGGTLGEVRMVHDGNSAFWVVILGQKVNPTVLANRLGNPSTWRGLTPGRTVSGGSTTNGSSTITAPGAGFDDGDVGRAISGTGIPADATITSVDSGSKAHISPAATATGSGVTFTLGTGNEDNKQTTWDAHATWLRKHLAAQFYGTPDDPCGYWPKKRINDETGNPSNAPLTGVYQDDASQQFVTERCFLWVYVWPVESGMFHGSMKLLPEG